MLNTLSYKRPLLAVLIDADNVSAKHAKSIMSEIVNIGEPALRRVYGDWSKTNLSSWKEPIHELGLVAHQDTSNTTGKNATDIGLVVDAMDFLHSGKFDGFVIVSSDSDFTALVNRLREEGLSVIGIGEKKTPEALRNVYNRFILIENLEIKDDLSRKVTSSPNKADTNHAYQLIKNAIKASDTEKDWVSLSEIGQSLRASHPDFDSRTYGFAKLSSLIKALPRLQFMNKNNHPTVRIKK